MVARRCGRALSNKLRGDSDLRQDEKTRSSTKQKMTPEKQKPDGVEQMNENSVLARSDGRPSVPSKCALEQANDKVDFPKDFFVVQSPLGTPSVTRMTRVQAIGGDEGKALGLINRSAWLEAQAQGQAEKDGVKETTQGTRDKYPGGSDVAVPDTQPLLPTQVAMSQRASAGGLIPRHVIGADQEYGEGVKNQAHVGLAKRRGTELNGTEKDPDVSSNGKAGQEERRQTDPKGTEKDPDDSGKGKDPVNGTIRMNLSDGGLVPDSEETHDEEDGIVEESISYRSAFDYAKQRENASSLGGEHNGQSPTTKSMEGSVTKEELSSAEKHSQAKDSMQEKDRPSQEQGLPSRTDDDALNGRHHHGQHAAVRGSALVPIHPYQGHVMGGVTQKNDHGTRASTTSKKERKAADVNTDMGLKSDTHVLVSSGTSGDLGDGRSNPVGEAFYVVAAGEGSSGTSVEKGPRSPFMNSGSKDAASPKEQFKPFLVVRDIKNTGDNALISQLPQTRRLPVG